MSEQEPFPIDTLMGGVLRQKRLWSGLTQQQLARRAGISFQQIQKYEAGVNRVSISRLFTMCGALGIKPSDLIVEVESLALSGGENGSSGFQSQLQFVRSPSARRAIKSLSEIENKDLLGALFNLISALEDEQPTR